MRAEIERILEKAEGEFGVAIKHLETGEELTINGDKPYPLASVVKIPILVALCNEAAAGNMDLYDKVQLHEQERIPGSGVLKELVPGTEVTLKDLATLMIIISDNMATDKLLQLLGIDLVNSHMEKLGLPQLSIQLTIWELLAYCVGIDSSAYSEEVFDEVSHLLDMEKEDVPVPAQLHKKVTELNTGSVNSLNLLLEKIENCDGIQETASQQIIQILQKQQYNRRIPRQLPGTMKVAHKTGTLRGVVNDVGIMYLPDEKGRVVISILSEGNPTTEAGDDVISQISNEVYNYFMGKK